MKPREAWIRSWIMQPWGHDLDSTTNEYIPLRDLTRCTILEWGEIVCRVDVKIDDKVMHLEVETQYIWERVKGE